MERPKPLKEGEVTEGTFATYCGLCVGVLGVWCSTFRGSVGRTVVTDRTTTMAGVTVQDCPKVIKHFQTNKV